MTAREPHDRIRLKFALGLTGGYCVVEFVGGWLTNSLALLSDAGHMLSDVTAMGLSLFAAYIATLPVNSQKTFGYYRAEILAAFLNGLALWLIASVGLAVNLVSVWLLYDSHHTNLNLHGVFLHIISDVLGSIGAIVAGILIMWT